MQSENDPRFDSFLEKIKMNAKADIYCVDIDENSSEEQIQKEKEKLYATGGFLSFPLKTDYINDRERIYTDKLRCQKMDSHDNSGCRKICPHPQELSCTAPDILHSRWLTIT